MCHWPVSVERGYACSTVAVKYLAFCIHKMHDKNKPDSLRSYSKCLHCYSVKVFYVNTEAIS